MEEILNDLKSNARDALDDSITKSNEYGLGQVSELADIKEGLLKAISKALATHEKKDWKAIYKQFRDFERDVRERLLEGDDDDSDSPDTATAFKEVKLLPEWTEE